MRVAVAVVMFLVSAAAGWMAFGLYRISQTPPPGPTDGTVLISGYSFTPTQVYATTITIAVLAALVGILALVAGHEKSAK
ncbi:MAG TPA: hypothetical protein VGP76_02490 [Planctomycetaceae bacterium]|jgi:hypothetical protein|nr:hypothetical protein [Planctomycetaceae bacterium]